MPGIVQANGSPDLRLTVTVRKRFGLMKTVDVTARCAKHDQAIEDPYVGCQACADDLRTLLG